MHRKEAVVNTSVNPHIWLCEIKCVSEVSVWVSQPYLVFKGTWPVIARRENPHISAATKCQIERWATERCNPQLPVSCSSTDMFFQWCTMKPASTFHLNVFNRKNKLKQQSFYKFIKSMSLRIRSLNFPSKNEFLFMAKTDIL